MKVRRILLFVVLLISGAALAWREGWLSPEDEDGYVPPMPADGIGQVGAFSDPILDEKMDYVRETREMVRQADFDGLEARVAETLKGKLKFANGDWKLESYYHALSECSDGPTGEWLPLQKYLYAWLEARPKSITPHIALACFYTKYAWDARGSGFADQVTEEGWELFRDRLIKADTILKKALALGPVRDPHFWSASQTVALGMEKEDSEHDEILRRGLEVEPEYTDLYTSHAYHLLPRWGGKPGELEAFAEKAATLPGANGDEIYARIAIQSDRFFDHLFQDSNFKWPRVKTGLEALRKRYPKSVNLLSSYAILSTRGNDRETAKRLFDELGNRLDKRTWGKQDRYLYYRNYVK